MSNSEVVDSVGNFAWLLNHSVNGLVKNFQAMSKVWFYGGVALKKGTNWDTTLRYLLSTACDPNGPDKQICMFCQLVYIMMTSIVSQFWMFSQLYAQPFYWPFKKCTLFVGEWSRSVRSKVLQTLNYFRLRSYVCGGWRVRCHVAFVLNGETEN